MSTVASETGDAASSSLRGNLELVERESIAGWALDDNQPDRPVPLQVLDNGTLIAEVLADNFRIDLQGAGIGDGHHAFSLRLATALASDRRHLIEVRHADDGRALPGSPKILEAVIPAGSVLRNAPRAPWSGNLDIVTRDRLAGWAYDPASPTSPVALTILDNGEVIGRALANGYRQDLANEGMGDGNHAFSVVIPGGFSPLTRHVVQVLGEADGCELPGSPVTLEAAQTFDAALEHAVSAAVGALTEPVDCERVLAFLAAQTERLLQTNASATAGSEARLVHRQFQRRWGKAADADSTGTAALPGPRALVVDDLVPALGRDAGSMAILSHMRALQALGFAVSFIASEELSLQDGAAALLAELKVECCRTPYYASVEEVLRRQHDGFDLIYLHRVSNAAKYLALARRYCRTARILYSVADLHNVRVARQAKVQSRPELLRLSRRLRLAECTAACSANAVITHSTAEAVWLRQAVTGCNVHVVPWAVPVRPTLRPFAERNGIAFVGSFEHAPNADAAYFLVEHIMPAVWRANPDIECLLVGSRMPESIKRLASTRVITLGHVPDINTIYEKVRLVAAPLRYGAGVKGKVLESLAAGVPCVMTPVAAEGIALPEIFSGAIAEEPVQIAARILRLYTHEHESQRVAQAGLACIAAGYDEQTVVSRLAAAVDARPAQKQAEAAINLNFT